MEIKEELYNAGGDEELKAKKYWAQDICYKYNHTEPSKVEERVEMIKNLFGKTKGRPIVEQDFWCDFGYNISVGEHFYMNHNCTILDSAPVEFGDHVLIGPNCNFYTVGHPVDPELRNQGIATKKPIKVGNNVWIGGNVVVLPGITIGDNVTIGAGSIVTKDIPSNSVAIGSPCKVIKKLNVE